MGFVLHKSVKHFCANNRLMHQDINGEKMNVKNTEMNHFIGAYYALHNGNFLPYSQRM